MAIDAAYYFRQLLITDSGVTGVVGPRVFQAPVPDAEEYQAYSGEVLFPCIGYSATGGGLIGTEDDTPVQDVVFNVFCMAETLDGAKAIFSAVSDFLNSSEQREVLGKTLCGIGQDAPETTSFDNDLGIFILEATFSFSLER